MRNPYRKFYTYLHCKPDGTPFYVGKGYRWRAFRVDMYRNPHHKNVAEKYGLPNILVYIFPCESEQEALSDEVRWIAQLRAEGIRLTNQTAGGDGMRDPSPEVRKKLSDLAMGNRWMVGKTIPLETRLKMSLAQKGKPRNKHSVETRAKMSASHIGHAVSDDTKKKLRAAHLGRGFKHTKKRAFKHLAPEHKARIAAGVRAARKHNAQVAAA